MNFIDVNIIAIEIFVILLYVAVNVALASISSETASSKGHSGALFYLLSVIAFAPTFIIAKFLLSDKNKIVYKNRNHYTKYYKFMSVDEIINDKLIASKSGDADSEESAKVKEIFRYFYNNKEKYNAYEKISDKAKNETEKPSFWILIWGIIMTGLAVSLCIARNLIYEIFVAKVLLENYTMLFHFIEVLTIFMVGVALILSFVIGIIRHYVKANALQKKSSKMLDELKAYYNDFGPCPVRFENTFPDAIKSILDLVISGTAGSVEEADYIYYVNNAYEERNSVKPFEYNVYDASDGLKKPFADKSRSGVISEIKRIFNYFFSKADLYDKRDDICSKTTENTYISNKPLVWGLIVAFGVPALIVPLLFVNINVLKFLYYLMGSLDKYMPDFGRDLINVLMGMWPVFVGGILLFLSFFAQKIISRIKLNKMKGELEKLNNEIETNYNEFGPCPVRLCNTDPENIKNVLSAVINKEADSIEEADRRINAETAPGFVQYDDKMSIQSSI